MTDKPIIFSAPMVRALLDGRKPQTRRIMKPQPTFPAVFKGILTDEDIALFNPMSGALIRDCEQIRLPYAPGDRLWVREAHALVPATAYRMSDGVAQTINPSDHDRGCIYRAGWDRCKPGPWRPSIHMPRWASRLTLTVTDVRVQRLKSITDSDAIAEGIEHSHTLMHDDNWRDYRQPGGAWLFDPRESFCTLWNSLHGPDAWAANPWVAAITFDVHRCNIDAMWQA